MTILGFTRAKCPELAGFLEACCASRLSFEGDEPNFHSACNHIHLWALEYWAERHDWIDLPYRLEFVREIFNCWRTQMRGLPPYQAKGYRLYLYEDLAPTVSVVAETPVGFPYSGCGPVTFVERPQDVLRSYPGKKWGEFFRSTPWTTSQERILEAVEKQAGSIGAPSANALGLSRGQLRRMIEERGLEREINALRKKFHRPPARFRPERDHATPILLYEQRLPARFR